MNFYAYGIDRWFKGGDRINNNESAYLTIIHMWLNDSSTNDNHGLNGLTGLNGLNHNTTNGVWHITSENSISSINPCIKCGKNCALVNCDLTKMIK